MVYNKRLFPFGFVKKSFQGVNPLNLPQPEADKCGKQERETAFCLFILRDYDN